MIAITLLPFETQYVRAKEHKEKLKIVKQVMTLILCLKLLGTIIMNIYLIP